MGEWINIFMTWALAGGEWSASRTDRFTPRERAPGILWIGDWVGQSGRRREEKILDPTGTLTLTPRSSSQWPATIPTTLSRLG
jgi:hypothetical protein